MKPYAVVFSPEAEADLNELYNEIGADAGPERAFGYIDRIMAYCEGFDTFPERGRKRDDLRSGLRVIGFERRVTIAFHMTSKTVVIDRILYGGRDLEAALGREA